MSDELDIIAAYFRKQIVPLSDFKLKKLLGKGGFGEVYKAKHIPSGHTVAVKILHLDKSDKDDVEMYAREIQILGTVNSPFLLRLFGFSIKEPFFIVTPYIRHGCLYDYVSSKTKKERLPPTNLTLIAMGIAYGMMNLHKMKIIHRDLKSPNILLDDRVLPIVCDFGIARANSATMTVDIGTTNWMAPEQMLSKTYNEKVDVYSYGSILYEMVANKMPFEEYKTFKVANEIMNGNRPKLPHVHKNITKLIEKCWKADPNERPSMLEIFKGFVTIKYYFDGTHLKGIESLLNLILTADSSMKSTFQSWMKNAKKPKDGTLILDKH